MVQQARVRKRLAVSVLVIAIFFAVCWFPYFFYYLWVNFASQEAVIFAPFPSQMDIFRYIGLVTPVLNTCLDPWILFVISSRHRACLVGCLKASTCCCKKATLGKGNSLSMRTMTPHTTNRQRAVAGAGTSFSRLSNA